MRALSIAATGMTAEQRNVEVIANNIANVNTTGFKRGRAEFSDLLYQNERPAGAPDGGDTGAPEALNYGLGVRAVGVRTLHTQGTFAQTGNSFDLALNGDGFFQLQGANNEVLYSRAGSFSKNAQGQIVNSDGHLLSPAITIPATATDIVISSTGQVSARVAGSAQLQTIGQVVLAKFTNTAGLEAVGGNLYKETAASGAPKQGNPGDASFASLQQGYLESSNVDPVKEMTELISAQRAYEMNSKVMQAADDMFSTITKGIR